MFQVVPILYDSDFLVRTKNNFLVVEVWKYCVGKNNTLIGICKLPLHQFYIAYRDPRVAANLVESKVIRLNSKKPSRTNIVVQIFSFRLFHLMDGMM